MDALSSIDRAIQSSFPLAIAPHEGNLPGSGQNGTRYIAAEDGIYREVQTEWMRRTKLHARCSLPYGSAQESVEFLLPTPPRELWLEFFEQSIAVLPNEHAALMVWNTTAQNWRLVARTFAHACPDRIDYIEPNLAEHDLAVVDVHSHATDRAFFSPRDNTDDAGGIKISACVGRVDASPEIVMRLVCIDEFIPIQMKDGKFLKQQRHETLHSIPSTE